MNTECKPMLTDALEAPPISLSVPAKRRVLVVTYDFPPNRTSAVYRMTGLTRSLPQYGWHPTVVTIQSKGVVKEPTLLEKLPPEVVIVRTKSLRINAWEDDVASAIHSVGGLRSKTNGTRKQWRFDSVLRSFAAFVRSTVYFPDDTVGWIPYALATAIKLH